jgi:tRNA nucleotidyltransferase/poly(A) polymerase
MTSQASLALIKFLSDLARQLGVGQHIYVVGGAVRNFVIDHPIKDRRAT